MLNKLLKYDLKKMYKILKILYALAIIISIFTRIFSELGKTIAFFNVIGIILLFIQHPLVINIIIHTFIGILMRFSKSLYGRESYLTHTLPIERKTLLNSKYISSLIVIFSSIIVSLVSLLIVYYSPTNMKLLINLLKKDIIGINISGLTFAILLSLLVFSQIFIIISIIMLGIIIGFNYSTNKTRNSLLISTAIYFASMIVFFIIAIILALITNNISSLFGKTITAKLFILLLVSAIIYYFICALILYIIGQKQFDKGVNIN